MTTTNKNTRFRDADSLSNNKNDGSSNNNDLLFKKNLQISSSNGIRQLKEYSVNNSTRRFL